jgi:branched-chain amino acid transport system permease protein
MALGAYLAGYATKTYGFVETADGDVLDFRNTRGVIGYFAALLLALALAAAVVMLLAWGIKLSRRLHPRLPGILTLALVVWFVADVGQAPHVPRLWSTLFAGGAGLFDAVAAKFTGGAAWALLPGVWSARATLLVALLGGGIVAAVAGFVVGLPTLRLRGDYLAIATLGFAEIIRVAITNAEPLGGATGMSLPVWPSDGIPELGVAPRQIFPWIYGTAFVTALLVWRLKYSPKGRALQAVRDDEIAAAAVGIDTTRHKVLAFVLGAFLAGVAGGVYAHYDGYLNPNSFGFLRSVELVVMVTLGGLGSIPGAVIAAAALTALPEVLRSAGGWLPAGTPDFARRAVEWVAENRMVVYSLMLILIMLARSRGFFTVRRGRRLRLRDAHARPAAGVTT